MQQIFQKDRKAEKRAMQEHNKIWRHRLLININQVKVEIVIRDYCLQVASVHVFINLGIFTRFLYRKKKREIDFRFPNYALSYFTISMVLQSEAVCSKCQVGILAMKTNKNAQTRILPW